MNKEPLASIIISSYNYARFLPEAIESALNQTYCNTEVIVVDDGSTDDSTQIIAYYGDRIIPLLKENGGQASVYNAGFKTSQGEVVCFLDSDDILLANAVENAVYLMRDSDVVKVHWPLEAVDTFGRTLGKIIPSEPLPEGNLQNKLITHGPDGFISSPTSGNAWSRTFLERILPMPEAEYVAFPDYYLHLLAPLFGQIKRIAEPQALYRIHGRNYSGKTPYSERVRICDHRITVLRQYLLKQGIEADTERWKGPTYKQIQLMAEVGQELSAIIPPGRVYILVDMNEWGQGALLENSESIPFLEKHGIYWGPPADDDTAIREFERLHRAGASFIVFGWPAFWWLDYYIQFHDYLQSRFQCVLENARLVVFDLQT